MRRRADGSYEEIDWDTAISEVAAGFKRIADTHGGDKIFYYGGGGQGNHLGGAYSSAFLKPLGSRYRSSALAQEKTGEFWVDSQLYGGHTRGEFEHAEVSIFVGKNPWMSQSFPRARTVLNDIAKDPARSMIVHRPGAHRHRQDGRLSPAGQAGRRRLVPDSDGGCPGPGEPLRRNLSRRSTRTASRRYATRCATFRSVTTRNAVASTRSCCVRRRAVSPPRTASRSSRISACSRHPTARWCSYLNKLLWILTGSFGKRGGQHLHSSFAPLFSGRSRANPGDRCADHRRADAVQRRTAGDPDRPSGPVPGHDRREQQPGPLDRRLGGLPCGVRIPGTAGGHRRRDDGDRPAGTLRAARGQPVREAGMHLLQSRVPAQRLSACVTRCSSRCPAPCPSRRSGRGWSARSASSATTTCARFARPPSRAATPTPRPSSPSWPATPRWSKCCPTSSTRPWARPCRSV